MQMATVVVKQFEDQIHDYTDNALTFASQVTPFLYSWVKKKKIKKLNICEFGGGGGNLLRDIKRKIKIDFSLTNAELVKKYGALQADKSIKFIHTSILDSKFKSNTFDVVIVRNVLHHLVGASIAKTRDNQLDGIRELVRVTKPGGLIVIEEQVNNNKFACLFFYYASNLASRLKIRIDKLQITPNTIVGYMTREKLQWMCERHVTSKYWQVNGYKHWTMPWYWKITRLMEDTGEGFIVMQKSEV